MDDNMAQARALVTQLVQTNTERFLRYGFLSPQWWLLLAFLIVPWAIWLKVADKTRKLEMVAVGLFVAIITKTLDVVGYNLNLWDYPIELVPLVPEAFSFDLSMIPVAYMLLHQWFKTWKSYCIGLLCMTLVYAFIGEPFCNWVKVVVYIKWNYLYSALYYVLMGITVRGFVEYLKGGNTIVFSSKAKL